MMTLDSCKNPSLKRTIAVLNLTTLVALNQFEKSRALLKNPRSTGAFEFRFSVVELEQPPSSTSITRQGVKRAAYSTAGYFFMKQIQMIGYELSIRESEQVLDLRLTSLTFEVFLPSPSSAMVNDPHEQ